MVVGRKPSCLKQTSMFFCGYKNGKMYFRISIPTTPIEIKPHIPPLFQREHSLSFFWMLLLRRPLNRLSLQYPLKDKKSFQGPGVIRWIRPEQSRQRIISVVWTHSDGGDTKFALNNPVVSGSVQTGIMIAQNASGRIENMKANNNGNGFVTNSTGKVFVIRGEANNNLQNGISLSQDSVGAVIKDTRTHKNRRIGIAIGRSQPSSRAPRDWVIVGAKSVDNCSHAMAIDVVNTKSHTSDPLLLERVLDLNGIVENVKLRNSPNTQGCPTEIAHSLYITPCSNIRFKGLVSTNPRRHHVLIASANNLRFHSPSMRMGKHGFSIHNHRESYFGSARDIRVFGATYLNNEVNEYLGSELGTGIVFY